MEEKRIKPPMVVLAGPTAVGKTRLSLDLAERLKGEIISADSMQVYRYMNIGSAKIRLEERRGIPHHLIDVAEPWEEFNVVLFKKKCEECLKGIYERGHIPIVTGGTGFYIQAILRDIDFTENGEDNSYRKQLEGLAEEKGPAYLHEMLARVDEPSARAIHANNVKRVIRALEYYEQTGERISDHNLRERSRESAYNSCYFVLNDIREKLYARIDARVEEMLSEGLLEEVSGLRSMGCTRDMVSMQGLGYKEMLAYLEGEVSYEEAVRLLKQNTRHFAKRQLTWFKREQEAVWLQRDRFFYEDEKILDYMIKELAEKGVQKI